jgi:hypothetical protein
VHIWRQIGTSPAHTSRKRDHRGRSTSNKADDPLPGT